MWQQPKQLKKREHETPLTILLLAISFSMAHGGDQDDIRKLIRDYAKAVNKLDLDLARSVWSREKEISIIHPEGHQKGWADIRKSFYLEGMGSLSERELQIKDASIRMIDGNAAWGEFYWDFNGTLKDGTKLRTSGRETQVWKKEQDAWKIAHVHYSEMPVAPQASSMAPAQAADPIIGIWELNVAKSTFSTAMQAVPPRELTEVTREIEGGRIELAQHGIQEDGAPVNFRATFPKQGGVVTIMEGEAVTEGEDIKAMTFIETLVSPGQWVVTSLRNGKQVIVRHKVISTDGKMRRDTVQGTDEHGQPFEQIEVYERIRQ